MPGPGPWRTAAAAWAVAVVLACAHEPDGSLQLVVDGLRNPGFEWIADSTTTPPKYGAYWLGAFSPAAGEAGDLVEAVDDAFEGERVLRLRPGDGPVLQKIPADPRWTADLTVTLAWRAVGGARLAMVLEDGPGRTTEVEFGAGESDAAGSWHERSVSLGDDFLREHGVAPVPRLNLSLRAVGPTGHVDVDAVQASVLMPRVDPGAFGRTLAALARETLDTWYLPRDQGGLGLVDPATGYVSVDNVHVETGVPGSPRRSVGFHTLHKLLVRWLRLARARGWQDELRRWTPELERIVRTLLDEHFDPDTHLPRTRDPVTGAARDDAVPVGAYVEFLIEARELLDDEGLRARCTEQVRRVADSLLALQAAHDLDPARFPNDVRLDRATGTFEGSHPNWFGHIPNKLAPSGAIDVPRRYNTAWAIVKGNTFWYHLFRSPAAIMAARALQPAEGDLAGVARALSRYQREWDASRYDLENDTDDHYGYLCEDLLELLRHCGPADEAVARVARSLVQQATDHRLAPDARRVDDTLWIQAVRLGTACAGDSPRAFKGLLDLLESSPNHPAAGLYRDALLELAANDFKGRQLTNGLFTESFFKDWEMVCICYRGTYQGDCREHPAEWWHGDVGDPFGGPPGSSIEAQVWAFRAADASERPEILARLATIHHVTETALRRPYGYLSGLDPAIARQYGLPEKYTTGLQADTAAGLGMFMSWLTLLPHLPAE